MSFTWEFWDNLLYGNVWDVVVRTRMKNVCRQQTTGCSGSGPSSNYNNIRRGWLGVSDSERQISSSYTEYSRSHESKLLFRLLCISKRDSCTKMSHNLSEWTLIGILPLIVVFRLCHPNFSLDQERENLCLIPVGRPLMYIHYLHYHIYNNRISRWVSIRLNTRVCLSLSRIHSESLKIAQKDYR